MANGNDNNGGKALSFWLRVASIIFTAWAAMIPLGLWIVKQSMEGYTEEMKENNIAHRVIDHRLDLLEERQEEIRRRQAEMDAHLSHDDAHIDELQRVELGRMRR